MFVFEFPNGISSQAHDHHQVLEKVTIRILLGHAVCKTAPNMKVLMSRLLWISVVQPLSSVNLNTWRTWSPNLLAKGFSKSRKAPSRFQPGQPLVDSSQLDAVPQVSFHFHVKNKS